MLILGDSGIGKSHAGARRRRASGRGDRAASPCRRDTAIAFVPQRPYLPLGHPARRRSSIRRSTCRSRDAAIGAIARRVRAARISRAASTRSSAGTRSCRAASASASPSRACSCRSRRSSILDEATSALDEAGQAALMRLVCARAARRRPSSRSATGPARGVPRPLPAGSCAREGGARLDRPTPRRAARRATRLSASIRGDEECDDERREAALSGTPPGTCARRNARATCISSSGSTQNDHRQRPSTISAPAAITMSASNARSESRRNAVLGITAAPQEYEKYVELAIARPDVLRYYNAVFGDIYLLNERLLPSLRRRDAVPPLRVPRREERRLRRRSPTSRSRTSSPTRRAPAATSCSSPPPSPSTGTAR